MDKYYGNVCELDIIFNFQKAYFILDELLLAGEMQESSKKNVLRCISQQDSLEDMEVRSQRSYIKAGCKKLFHPGSLDNCPDFILGSFPLFSTPNVPRLTFPGACIRSRMMALPKSCDDQKKFLGFHIFVALDALGWHICMSTTYDTLDANGYGTTGRGNRERCITGSRHALIDPPWFEGSLHGFCFNTLQSM